MEETRIEEIRSDEMSAEMQSAEKPREKKRYSLKIQKTVATLLITVGLAVAAFCGVRLLTLALNTDALDIHMDDWLENKEYGDSDTLAWHMASDMDDVITYMGLQQILEEDGALNLERPALVVQQEDGEIVTYTAQDLVTLGEKAGIYVYDEVSENGNNAYYYDGIISPTEESSRKQRVRILWSLMNQEDASVDLGADAWAVRQERIDKAIAQAKQEDAVAILAAKQIPSQEKLEQLSLSELVKLCGDLPTLYPGVASFSNEQLLDWHNRCQDLETREQEILSQRPVVEEELSQQEPTWEETGETVEEPEAPEDNTEAADVTVPVTEEPRQETTAEDVYWTPELHEVRQEQIDLRWEIYESLDDRREIRDTTWGYLFDFMEYFLTGYLQDYYQYRRKFEQAGNLVYAITLTQGSQTVTYQDHYTTQNGRPLHQQADWDMSYVYDSSSRRIETDMPASTREIPIHWLQRMCYQNYDSAIIRFGMDVDHLELCEDAYSQEARVYQNYRNHVFWIVGTAAIGALAVLVGMIWMIPLCGRRDGDETIHLNLYDRIPTELGAAGIVLLGLGVCMVFILGDDVVRWILNERLAADVQLWMLGGLVVALLILAYLMLWWGFYGLIRRLKAHTFWKNSLCAILIRWCMKPLSWCGKVFRRGVQSIKHAWNDLMDYGDTAWKTAAVFVGYLVVNTILWLLTKSLAYYRSILYTWLLMFIFNGLVGVGLVKKAAQRKRIRQGVTKLASGKLDHKLPLEELSGEEKKLAQEINQIGGGLKTAVEESLKNERMKTELITNVSHDIKTPLTSIINYVDLLKREHIQDPKIQGYIQVLDQKSQRLKTLTEDLVEASKASSGTLQMTREKIDFVELINQTTGEFSDRFAAVHLNLVTNIQETPAYIMADGRYVWRILENLYRNAEKYSMPGTRVYIEVFEKIGRVFFVMKNVSNAPLNIKAEELTERFIRGDVSRTTEGSGLGLSIAKDMTELMDGTFRVYLDGDLFRVTVSFAVIREEKPDLREMEESIRRRVAEEEKKGQTSQRVQVETADVVEESGLEQSDPSPIKKGVGAKDNKENAIKLPKLPLPKISLPKRKKKEDTTQE